MAPGSGLFEHRYYYDQSDSTLNIQSIATITLIATALGVIFVFACVKLYSYGQKTRSPQQRRMYVGQRARPSLSQTEPTIYVSPNNLPPPPKYEAMAPPSYEEVVGTHYPNYQIQPITQPIVAAMQTTAPATGNTAMGNTAPTTTSDATTNVTIRNTGHVAPTVITVTADEQRTSVSVAT